MASDPVRIAESVKFGEDLELDLRAYELRRSGQPLKLERIPMELLLLLVQARGQLVSREEIVTKVWGPDVFLESDTSINTAIRKIRQALQDNPEHPRFIQTVTGKGYRFIGPIIIEAPPVLPQLTAEAGVQVAEPAVAAKHASRSAKWMIAGACVLLLAAIATYLRVRSATPSRQLLAVLPFANLTGDPGQEYFSDGLTEEMISQLNDLDPQRLGVIARSSVMQYKQSRDPLGQAVRELGVDYVLEGSVRRDGGRLRITTELTQAKTRAVLWSRQYDREVRDLLGVESDIAREVASEIRITLPDSSKPRDELLDAHDAYLRGRYYWNKRTVEGFRLAQHWFREAIYKDPNYAQAYAGLAQTHALISGYDSTAPADEEIPKALAAAQRAIELDPQLADAHIALAIVAQNYQWDWATAEREYLRALQLNPNHATAHHWYGEFLALQGRFEEAFREIDQARKLDPLSLIIASDYGAILYYARQYDRAIEELRSVVSRDPDFPRAHVVLGPFAEKHMFAEALADIDRWRLANSESPWMLSWLAYIYGRSGDQENARRTLDQLQLISRGQQVDPAVFVLCYIGIDDKDHAFYWLDRSMAARSPTLNSIKVNPMFDPLRGDPRFAEVLRKMRLEK